MPSRPPDNVTAAAGCHLSESEWQDLRTLVTKSAGIKLSDAKRMFLVSRLLKRLRATGVSTFREYFRYVITAGNASSEHQQLINAVTTNKTDFFRESEHFSTLVKWLNSPSPDLRRARARGLRIWCAASSTGEEPYTIAAVLRETLSNSEWLASKVFASDIDTDVLGAARRAVYDRANVEVLAANWRESMFVRGSGTHRDSYRVRRELRERVEFFQHNLTSSSWKIQGVFDAVFCRNVLIYFERAVQEQVVRRLLDHTADFGLLFLGHAETLNGASVSAKSVGHSVYTPNRAAALNRELGRRDPNRPIGPEPLRDAAPESPAGRALGQRNRLLAPFARLQARLEDAVLLVVYDEQAKKTATAVIRPTLGEDVSLWVLREARRLGQLLRHSAERDRTLTTKVVATGLAVRLSPDTWSPLNAALAEQNLQLQTVRQFDVPLRIELEPQSGRIRLRESREGSVLPPESDSCAGSVLAAGTGIK